MPVPGIPPAGVPPPPGFGPQPPPGGWTPPGPPPKKTSPLLVGCIGCAVLLIALFVLFIIIGAMTSKGGNSGKQSGSHQQGDQGSQAANRTTIRFDNGKRIAGVVVDGTVYGIYSQRVTASIGGTEFTQATQASGRFVILQMFVRNETNKTREISLSRATLIDSSGNAYDTSSEGGTALTLSGDKEAEFLLSEIHPHLQKYVKIVFDVPADRKAFTLRIPHGLLSGGQDGDLPVKL
jgi:Domain of unknown function (DUF4352)